MASVRLPPSSPSRAHRDGPAGARYVVFKNQEPLMCVLYSNDANIRAACLMMLVTLLLSFVAVVVCDSVNAERLAWNLLSNIDSTTWQGVATCMIIEVSLHIALLLVHPLFKLWVSKRGSGGRYVDGLFILLFVTSVLLSFPFILWACSRLSMPKYLRNVLAVEQIRVCLKAYSFIRENAYKVLYPWHKDDDSGPAVWYDGQMSPSVGSFSQFCYFIFSPTLLYRDHYPRLSGPINWKTVLINFIYFIGGVVLLLQCYTSMQSPLHWKDMIKSFFTGQVVNILVILAIAMSVLHGYMTMMAELMRFADRRFYEDWWNSSTYTEWYRKWNTIPHHFIHQYIYRDIKNVTKSRVLALFLATLMSGIFHEYVAFVATGFFIPVLTFLFAGLGVSVAMLINCQVLVLLSMHVGINMICWFYDFEILSRRLCSREETAIDLFYPRLLECATYYNQQ